MSDTVPFTAACPACGEDTLWTATRVLVSTGRVGSLGYGPNAEGVRYDDDCPCGVALEVAA